jgi:acetoin utilization protein AcuB
MSDAKTPITIHEFMTPAPQTIEHDLELGLARERLFQINARHLPVVKDGNLVGILSQRDIALLEATPAGIKNCMVEHAMTANPFTCGPDAHLHAVAQEMADHKFGAAVIVDPEHPTKVLGVFTTTDGMRALATLTNHES